MRSQVVHAFQLAVNDSFRLATAFSLIGLVVACFMRTRPLRSSVRTRDDGDDAFDAFPAEAF